MQCDIRAAMALAVAAFLLNAGSVFANDDALVYIEAGEFVVGSDRDERESAYRLDEAAYGHRVTREQGWYENEPERTVVRSGPVSIMRDLVTNARYARFVDATGRAAPDVTLSVWKGYGLIHPYERTRRHAWQDGRPPPERLQHPVVLVSYDDAVAYAAWYSKVTDETWRLPTEHEWERAARGDNGARFPWGEAFTPDRLNSHDQGPFDTVPVGRYPGGASPHGLNDAAGQVFEWTATGSGDGRFIVKGGSWDDSGCGVCRPAARHGRPRALKHILIGFRLVRDTR